MVVNSESNSSAVDVERMCTRVWAIVQQAVCVFALSLELCSRSLIAVCCQHDEALENSRVRALASAYDTYEEPYVERRGQHHPHSDSYV